LGIVIAGKKDDDVLKNFVREFGPGCRNGVARRKRTRYDANAASGAGRSGRHLWLDWLRHFFRGGAVLFMDRERATPRKPGQWQHEMPFIMVNGASLRVDKAGIHQPPVEG
jgi:hypothetical protein